MKWRLLFVRVYLFETGRRGVNVNVNAVTDHVPVTRLSAAVLAVPMSDTSLRSSSIGLSFTPTERKVQDMKGLR